MALVFDNVQEATLYALKNYPNTRNDDSLLASKVYELINPAVVGLKFNFVLEHKNDLNLPSFGSITRYRRLLQNNHKHLKANAKIESARADLEEKYRSFARGN